MEKTKELSLKEQLEQKKKEIKELERQMKLEAAKDVVAVVTKAITDDEHVNEVLGDYTAEEGQIIGKRVVANIDEMVEKSQDEIKALREKKAEREARRKERQAKKKAEKKADPKSAEPVKHDDPKPVQTMTEPVKQSEQKPVHQVAQTAAPQVQQNAQQPIQRPVQAPAQAAQQTQQKPVPGNVMYSSQGASQTQSGNGIRYTPDGGR